MTYFSGTQVTKNLYTDCKTNPYNKAFGMATFSNIVGLF